MPGPRELRPGQLRQRVEIQMPVESPDSYGQPLQDWQTIASRWASVEPLTSRELIQAQQVRPDVTHRITMRYLAGLKAKHRIKWGNRIFQLDPPLNYGEQKGTTLVEVLAKEEV